MSTVLNFETIFQDFIDATKKEWAHDRSESVGASEAFDCIRKVWFRKFGDKHGHPADPDFKQSWGATKRGDLIEMHYVAPAVRDNLPGTAKLLWSGDKQKTLFKGHNSATPDGIIIGLSKDALSNYGIEDIESDCVMFEIKSVDPRVRLENEKKIHHGQTQVQMGIVRDTTPYKPMYAVIVYIDASFLDNIKAFVVKFEPEYWQAGQDRADLVFETTDPAELPAEGKFDGACEFCSHKIACGIVTNGTVPEDTKEVPPDYVIEEFTDLIFQYDELKKAKEDADEAFELMQAHIKERLKHFGRRKVGVKNSWNISWSAQKGRKTLDVSALTEAAGIEDLEPFYREGAPFDVLRVTFTN